jgi:hypothetical protein
LAFFAPLRGELFLGQNPFTAKAQRTQRFLLFFSWRSSQFAVNIFLWVRTSEKPAPVGVGRGHKERKGK